MIIKHVVLDRDGVLNDEAPASGYVSSAAEFRWLPGALQSLADMHRAGVRLSIATNQSGIGRGVMTRLQLEAVHAAMRQSAERHGGRVDAIFFCPHAPEANCDCRKPAPGLINAAVEQAGIAASETLVVGDDLRDIDAAQRAGVPVVLVRTGKGRVAERGAEARGVRVFDDLLAVSREILRCPPVAPEAHDMTIQQVFAEHLDVTARAAVELPPVIEQAVRIIHESLTGGGKLLACGNGGSAADAQHLVAELVGRFRDERRALAAVTLMADAATLTALANDYGYDRVFARQVEALAQPGDVLFAISTSGNSPSVLNAAAAARLVGCKIVALTGAGGGKLAALADLAVRAPSTVVARIQEVHALSIHAIADALDVRLLAAAS